MMRTEEQKARQREYMKKYRADHPEKVKEAMRRSREKNPTLYRTYSLERAKGPGRTTHAKAAAKRRGLVWEISREEHLELLKNACSYCAGSLNETGSGLDRIDNAQGYVLGNVVPCCNACNSIRGIHLTHEQMQRLAPMLEQFRLERF